MKLAIENASYSFSKNGRQILNNINFTAESGSYWCIAGPNGAGKSTFLKLAAGLLDLRYATGEVSWIDDTGTQSIRNIDRLNLAKKVAFVPGSIRPQFDISVSDFVLQGRYAHSPGFGRSTVKDEEIAEAAMAEAGIDTIGSASITEISAGELQLALIARALCQQSDVLIFDEATANLDLSHQTRIFGLFESLNRRGKTVFVVSHDLNLAAEFCTNFLWLSHGTVFTVGTAEQTVTTETLAQLYGKTASLEVGRNPFTGRPKIFLKS